MTSIISHGLRDSKYLQIVSVIASFDTLGNMKPLYVRIREESFKIVSCRLKPTVISITTFQCQILDNDVLKPLELTYHYQERMWSIPNA